MQELRFVAVSEDGSYAVLAVPGRSARYVLPIDEKLRAVALGQTSRLAQYEIEVESPLRPKEIQARIRAGETAEEIADAAGIPVERVRWFEGPVLAERAYIAQQAQTAVVRRQADSAGPGPRLSDIVSARLTAFGADPEDGQWDSRKRGDGSWQVQLTYSAGGRLHIAEWVFDPRRRHVTPDDDTAARLSLPESELPPLPASLPGEATVTPIAPRLGAAASGGRSPEAERAAPERPAAYAPAAYAPPAPYAPPGAPPVTGRPVTAAPAFREAGRSRPPAQDPAAPDRPAAAPWRIAPPPEFLEDPGPALADPEPAADPEPDPAPEAAPAAEAALAAEEVPAASVPEAEAAPAAEKAPAADPEPDRAPEAAPAAEKAPAAAAEAGTGDAPVTGTGPDPGSAAAEPGAEPGAEPAARDAAAPATDAGPPGNAAPEPAPDPAKAAEAQQGRRPGKKNPRNRRSSVPSWDEIMLGSSRQRD
jgi:hypothetical protein